MLQHNSFLSLDVFAYWCRLNSALEVHDLNISTIHETLENNLAVYHGGISYITLPMNLKWGPQSFFIHIYSFHWPKLTWCCSNTTLTTSFKKGFKMLSLLITQPVTSISCSSFHFLNSLFQNFKFWTKKFQTFAYQINTVGDS